MDRVDHPHQEHRVHPVTCAVITVSDTRTLQTDQSGALICELLGSAGHSLHVRDLLPDEPEIIRERVRALCDTASCHAILLTGGTGLAARDTTFEAVASLLEKKLDGFGELFRTLSYPEIGAAAMLSRAVAGVRRRTAIFSMPGSVAGVRLAMDRLILPQLSHVAWLLS